MAQTAEDDSPAALTLTCNETDALFQIKYYITADRWTSGFWGYKYPPFLKLQGNMVRFYKTFADLTDYEACLPRDECYEVVVGGLPTDAYTLSFDGKAVAVDIGDEFMFDGNNPVTSTEVGTCTKPVCKDTEALLEIHYWNGDFAYTEHAFRVEDKDGNTILQGEESDESYSVNNTYACLPKDDSCYMFLIGGREEWDANYSIIFDGKLVRRSDSWLFDSVQFGDSCEPRCNQDD